MTPRTKKRKSKRCRPTTRDREKWRRAENVIGFRAWMFRRRQCRSSLTWLEDGKRTSLCIFSRFALSSSLPLLSQPPPCISPSTSCPITLLLCGPRCTRVFVSLAYSCRPIFTRAFVKRQQSQPIRKVKAKQNAVAMSDRAVLSLFPMYLVYDTVSRWFVFLGLSVLLLEPVGLY